MEKSTIKFYTFSILLCYFREREGGVFYYFLYSFRYNIHAITKKTAV